MSVDVVVLTPDNAPLGDELMASLQRQQGVQVRLHRVIATPLPGDTHRRATIVRGRNEGRRLGNTPWLMFLDDDVVLDDRCIATLLQQLLRRPLHAALAADYLGESPQRCQSRHVAMGATLFRRAALDHVSFRWTQDLCECQCCCDDLRRRHWEIAYEPRARARHIPRVPAGSLPEHTSPPQLTPTPQPGQILAAFNRRHLECFRRQFLPSLRTSGNSEQVTAVTYGLYPSEVRHLQREPGVNVFPVPKHSQSPARRRLWDFQAALDSFPAQTPVAYWDAGDVVFRGSLAPLWAQVRNHPDKLLAVREPLQFDQNPAAFHWAESITDESARQQALGLLKSRPVLNSGFAAAMKPALLKYFQAAASMWESPTLSGSTDWGDQTALNIYCHTQPDRWLEVDAGWNYCLYSRRPSAPPGTLQQTIQRIPSHIRVIHGNAGTLPPF